jgi:RecB family exonuclease
MVEAGLHAVSGRREEIERVLASYVAEGQASDPLTPVAVLIGGTLMRPYLQRRLATLNGGIANVHFLTASEFALALGERSLVDEGRRPLPPLADRVLLRQIGGEHDGYFEPVRDTPGFGDALHRLTRELRGAGYGSDTFGAAIENTCDAKGKAEALNSIFVDFLKRRSALYGPDDCLLAAKVGDLPWERLAIFGVWNPPAALLEVLASVAERIPVGTFLPATGTSADTAVADFAGWLDARGATPAKAPAHDRAESTLVHVQSHAFASSLAPAPGFDGTVALLSAPDPTREIREVARTCIAWAREGIAFHEMAIVYRHQDAYRPVIEAVFGEASIPLYLHEGTPLIERPLGRRVAALLDLIGTDLDRRTVMDFLSDAFLPKSTRDRYDGVSATRWDRISREAGVVAGLDQWRQRLTAFAESERARGNQYANAERAEDLLAFVTDLAKALTRHEATASWSAHLESLRKLVGRYVSKPDAVLDALEGLGRLDTVTSEVSFDRFREIVRGAIETLRSDEVLDTRQGAFGRRGVNVLDANSARHLSFRAVAIVGLAERSFPSPPRPDPLLLDDERAKLNAAGPAPIPLRTRGADPEPLQFALAVSSAHERLLVTYPRKGVGDGRPQLPSSFFRAVAEAAVGKPVPVEQIDSLDRALFVKVLGTQIGPQHLDHSLSEAERDRALIETDPAVGAAALVAAQPRVARAFAARTARWENRTLTPFDGVLGDEAIAALAKDRPKDHSFSPSGLKQYAVCPHQFFLSSVLRLREAEEPEDTIRMSAMDRGTLIHRVLERFLGEEPQGGKLLHGAGEEDRLFTILEEECDAAETRGDTGYELTWRYDREELREDLRLWLENERNDAAFSGMSERAFETRFGRRYDDSPESELSRDDPIEIIADGVELRVSGRIDRLEWNEETRRFRVIDYKTGALYGNDAGRLRGGQALQLPLYLLAAEELIGMPAASGSAEYHYATRRGGFSRVPFSGEDLAARREDFEKVLGGMVTGTRTGLFPMTPDQRVCDRCDFDEVCPAGRFAQMRRKGDDARLVALEEIRAIE